MSAIDDLVTMGMRLRMVAPQQWEDFVLAMRQVAATTTHEMLRADSDKLQRAQGMAVMVNEIATVLRETPMRYEKAQEIVKKKAGHHV